MIKADITYPDYFPSPLLSSNTRQRGLTFSRGDSNNGLATQRKAFTFQPVMMNFSIICDVFDAQMFENFFFKGLNNGVRWFNIKRKTPHGLKDITVRFTEMYKFTAVTNSLFKYDCKIEVLSND